MQEKMLGQELTGERAAELCAYNCKVSPNAFYKVSIVKSIGCFTFSYNSDEYTGLVYLKSCENVDSVALLFIITSVIQMLIQRKLV